MTGERDIGARNPYVMAELIENQPVDWAALTADDRRARVASVFDRPFEELLDPANVSPLFHTSLIEASRSGASERAVMSTRASELFRVVQTNPQQLALMTNLANLDPSGIRDTTTTRRRGDLVAERAPEEDAPPGWERLNGSPLQSDAAWTDPVQGAIGDCWLIAVLGSIAWTHPEVIESALSEGTWFQHPLGGPVKLGLRFYKKGEPSAETSILVSDVVPKVGASLVYARSSQADETWPALFEKGYALLLEEEGAVPHDQYPDYTTLDFGWSPNALVRVLGKPTKEWETRNLDAAAIWDLLNLLTNQNTGKLTAPAWAGTYRTAADAPDSINYGTSGIVACHAYSVLGALQQESKQYLVLRNPWGQADASLDVAAGDWQAFDKGAWVTTPLATNDGVFAVEASTFKKYFATFGYAA